MNRGQLNQYRLVYAARPDLFRRNGQTQEAIAAYQKALTFVRQEPEQRFIRTRLPEMSNDTCNS